jgi:hypothetical protein
LHKLKISLIQTDPKSYAIIYKKIKIIIVRSSETPLMELESVRGERKERRERKGFVTEFVLSQL